MLLESFGCDEGDCDEGDNRLEPVEPLNPQVQIHGQAIAPADLAPLAKGGTTEGPPELLPTSDRPGR